MKVLSRTHCCQSVDHPVKLFGHKKTSVRIDIVAENNREWIKVIARNPKALNDIALGRSNFGTKSILDHASDCVQIAKDNLHNFQEPTVLIIIRTLQNPKLLFYMQNYFRLCLILRMKLMNN